MLLLYKRFGENHHIKSIQASEVHYKCDLVILLFIAAKKTYSKLTLCCHLQDQQLSSTLVAFPWWLIVAKPDSHMFYYIHSIQKFIFKALWVGFFFLFFFLPPSLWPLVNMDN